MTADLVKNRKFDRKPYEALWRHLASFAPLSDQEMSIIRQTSAAATELAPGAELYVEGQYLSKPAALLSGWACRLRVLADGRRQIFDFLLPGDLFGHCTALNTVASTSALTLTTARIASAGCLFEMAVEPKRFPGALPRLGGGAGAAGRLPP
ncbi:MAG: cyclic nucleotide-binding domain-containing protein [Rhodoplanes sp.]